MKIVAKFSFCLVLFLGLFCYAGSAENHNMLACVGGTVYPSPTAEPIKDAAVLMETEKLRLLSRSHA